jgi:bifunctional non-homologous end joining protein LigD
VLWRLRPFPDFVEPCLPSPRDRPPAGPDWIHEIKHDGFRLIARRGAERVRLFTRNGHDWTERFPQIVEAVLALRPASCLIDGELIVCDEGGLADFGRLRSRQHDDDAALCAFDLIELDGRDLGPQPIEARKAALAKLLDHCLPGLVLNFVFEQDGPLVFEHACLLGCEGIVSKRKDPRYRSGRSPHWVRTRQRRR